MATALDREARRAFEAYRDALAGEVGDREDWSDLKPEERNAWKAALLPAMREIVKITAEFTEEAKGYLSDLDGRIGELRAAMLKAEMEVEKGRKA